MAVKKLSAHARGTLTNNRDNAIRCKEALYQLFCEIWEGQVAVAKLEGMLVMHCMTNAVLEYQFICKFHQKTDLEK